MIIIIEHEDHFEIGFEDFMPQGEITFSIAPLGEDYRILIFNDRQITLPYQFLKELYKKPLIKLFTYTKLESGMIVGYPIAEIVVDKDAVWKVL
ncbi:hypothetical protein Thal_0856 [Thermocrinis albus DSM 14484]|uniref:Uncharacterized protein n=1 Tax=Thermocrinis albus (strain DSM 14484 / JCM 11386 / HI 11/12) TaxID=638303 RepID=D3SL59_THEAH|nr:hypothetical protein [Thermocrinis albus]ADC89489.1 hypothetical protein Thal_0856 [Thermocrinis albus DSM 14484]